MHFEAEALSYAAANWMFKHFQLALELPAVGRKAGSGSLVFELPAE
jgi:hypothetical protein